MDEEVEETAAAATERQIGEAEERGRLAAVVDSRLADHDRHLSAINGSIGDMAREQRAMREQMVEDATREEDRDEEAKRQAATNVSTRTFVLGVLLIIATVIGTVLSQVH